MKACIALLFLILSALACMQPVTVTPTPALTPTDRPAKLDTPAPSPTATAPAIIPAGPETARVAAASLNVRKEPDGDPTGEYVYAGQSVTVLEYSPDGKWARIETPAGWVYLGCLNLTMESGLGCTAKP